MLFLISFPRNLIWVFLVFSILVSTSRSNPRISQAEFSCGTNRQSPDTDLVPNFIKVMGAINEDVSNNKFCGTSYVVTPYPSVYILSQCHKDLSESDCLQCFSECKRKLTNCLTADSGRIYLDGCFLRYGKYNFFREYIDPIHDQIKCSTSLTDSKLEAYMYKEFHSKLDQVLNLVAQKAVENDGFGAGEVKGAVIIYALAQCWQTLDQDECRECLINAGSGLSTCGAKTEGRALFTGCYMRYSTEKFFNNGAERVNGKGSKHKRAIEFIIAGVTVALLAGFGAYMGYERLSKMKEGLNGSGRRSSGHGSKHSMNFKYETLEKATECFDNTRKLGQGGAGSVFKGILPDGKIVAVKKLFFNTRQWVDQFFNEVNLISEIQHKNLVKLLGCSIEGPESLLVYEYVPNKSLDQILFVKNTIHILSWQQRFNIISGTAEGLAYLHGGSGVKIIHRDIKTSNILLDEKLTPKIADFGLARCVGPDKTHLSTGIAGTLGYMAPEYLVRGQLTEKADIYAFGVLVLEVATGRKNSVFSHGSSSILYSVWKHYKANSITQPIDPGLNGRFDEKEASKVLQIGLLCTQTSVELRPSMSEVVQMLTDPDCEVPSPKQPPFLNASVLSPDDTTKTSSIMECSDLNEQKTTQVSATYPSKSSIIASEESNDRNI